MKCPYCGNDMEKGYITTNGALIAFSNDEPNAFYVDSEIWIARSYLRGAYNEAYHCPDCRIVATQYSEELNKGNKIKQETDRRWKQRQEIANEGKKP